ncbi:GNAT family N-acetyltransferase [Brevibacterium aurantiacum]|uniref:Histone acetyltransferase HPA2-related acetyltransferase n=1 Tax=Brevibacterium aurantiacum TaxID=273384 RepID=A0A1D7W2U5_BREAU|nr:GNAT family N-acetyltransferase [Brevibacterium aurantiacum]AOP53379.1 Histone acetyltransferase HPA2-related acetyltransferase [Brevibacterium aurantiacum]AZT93280.1 N-acetyltransferase [Brevibacterium aurantiacum]PCC44238.1 N-acetyltransferase [Brevibacterium aurantiacum]RCS96414.1 GNAT family N-acetyltransferase [Brevibacterium aurantiacum]RCS97625.1 GNAT family N-acetyltransferase [Brevibacterium aurantiacum]
MDDLQPGKRVVVRYSLEPGDSHSTSDALGVVNSADESFVEIGTKRGPIRIAREQIMLVHEVPPAPTKSGRTHEIVSAVDLRRISAAAWLPADISWLHMENLRNESSESDADIGLLQKGWLLRSSDSVTRRANSCLPVTDTGMDWEQSLDAVEAWYSAREKPSCVQIYSADDSSTLAPACEGLAPLLSARGYSPCEPVFLLAGSTAEAAAGAAHPGDAAAPGLSIDFSEEPSPMHYAAWTSERDPGSADAFRSLIEASDPCQFVTAYADHPDGSRTMVASARIVERSKWGVLTNLVTHPDLRRRGAGRSVARAAAALLSQRGVRSYLVDVEASNEASLNLFTSLGATVRHRSWYASRG